MPTQIREARDIPAALPVASQEMPSLPSIPAAQQVTALELATQAVPQVSPTMPMPTQAPQPSQPPLLSEALLAQLIQTLQQTMTANMTQQAEATAAASAAAHAAAQAAVHVAANTAQATAAPSASSAAQPPKPPARLQPASWDKEVKTLMTAWQKDSRKRLEQWYTHESLAVKYEDPEWEHPRLRQERLMPWKFPLVYSSEAAAISDTTDEDFMLEGTEFDIEASWAAMRKRHAR